MNAGESLKGGTVERPRGRKQAEARRRTHRLAPGVIGFSLVMVFATFAFVVMPAPVHANPLKICEQCPNAPSQCEPNCGGGGGGTPLSLVLMGSPPSGVSATTGCVSNPGGMCIPQFSSSYSAPITSPSGTYYASTYTALASGGNGAYTYYWSYPGSNGWVAGSSVMSYEPKSVGSFTVSAEITESGFSSVSVGLSVSISAAPEPGGQSYSYGLAGWALSLNQAETQWVLNGLLAGVAAGTLASAILAETVIGAPAAGILTLFTGVIAGYAAWVGFANQGNGVYFAWVWAVLVPFVGANPVPWGY